MTDETLNTDWASIANNHCVCITQGSVWWTIPTPPICSAYGLPHIHLRIEDQITGIFINLASTGITTKTFELIKLSVSDKISTHKLDSKLDTNKMEMRISGPMPTPFILEVITDVGLLIRAFKEGRRR